MKRQLVTLATLHLVAVSLLLWLGYYWLGIGETKTATLFWSLLVAVFILSFGSAVFGADLVYFRKMEDRSISGALRTSGRNILPLLIAALAIAVLYGLLQTWAAYSGRPAFQVASYLTLKLRIPVKPASVARVFNTVLWLVRWMAIPAVLIPVVGEIASLGWSGFRAARMTKRKWIYWIAATLVLVCTVKVPLLLVDWKPAVDGFGLEAVSFAVRAVAGWLLFGCGWIALAYLTSGGNPRLTQPRTAVSP